ncbi:hypothetical protein CROQUDRAFT_699368 [Cronartium quercuum f. sp. fusiforme G11]|uniref:DUF7721 domain-containing protein n=1 Tax=Cronartium quercuum f. sp. fusiforme G11 TaxID=708437 RepID=A0A9P6TCX0_9BASI|nr:hypothetical protein CROQUDRAFT_699368 [Cronartium quercuum f. sp. fusiforme G11]
MDNFINLGTKAFKQFSEKNDDQNSQGESYGRHHSQSEGGSGGYGVTGGAHLNRPAGEQMIDTDGDGIPDFQEAANQANEHADGAADPSLFNNALAFLKNRNKKDDEDEIDESRATEAHDRAYNQGQGSSLDASSMGAAAALQAFKQFSSGGGSSASQSGGGGQGKLIGMAMAQAAKLFDKSGGASSGGKQDAVNSAGQMIMKLLMKQKMNQMVGGSNSGGLSGLASLAEK